MAELGHISWWQRLQLPWRRWRVVTRVDAGDEVPEELPARGIVLVGPPNNPTWAAFDCPCRRGHRLMVNLDPSRHPSWRILTTKPITLRPSVDDITPERRCHFIMDAGRIKWAHGGQETRR